MSLRRFHPEGRRLSAGLVSLFLFVALGVAWAAPSSANDGGASAAVAAAPCYHSTCKGKNPQTTGCGNDATTIDSFDDGNFYVELRHSALCGAVWTRINTHKGDAITACDITFAQIRAYEIDGTTLKYNAAVQATCNGSGAYTTGGVAYTTMLSFADYVRACESYWTTQAPHDCTNKH